MKTVSSGLLENWLEMAKTKGHDLKALLKVSGISWSEYRNPRSRFGGEQLGRLSAEIRRLMDDDFLGYAREALKPALRDRFLIKLLARARNLGEALIEWENFYNLVQNAGTIATAIRGNEFVYRFQFKDAQQGAISTWVIESTLFKLRLFSWLTGKRIELNSVGFTEPASPHAEEYASLLPAKIFYDQPSNFFTIDKQYLLCPVVRTVEESLNYKKHLPEDFFAVPGDERLFAFWAERMMRDSLEAESRLPGIERIAEQLSISVRGLRRKLESEGQSFQQLKDRLRCDLAVKKLDVPEIPIEDIAVDLGFSETSAFCRAFKAWTTSTPREYRTRLLERAGGT